MSPHDALLDLGATPDEADLATALAEATYEPGHEVDPAGLLFTIRTLEDPPTHRSTR